MFLMKCSNINDAESADLSITVYLAMTHYLSILWPQIPPLVFHPCHQKAFHLSCYRTISSFLFTKGKESTFFIVHPEALSGRTKTNFNQNTFQEKIILHFVDIQKYEVYSFYF